MVHQNLMQAVIYTKHEPPNHSPGGMLQMAYPMRRHAKAEIMKARLRPRYRATRSGPSLCSSLGGYSGRQDAVPARCSFTLRNLSIPRLEGQCCNLARRGASRALTSSSIALCDTRAPVPDCRRSAWSRSKLVLSRPQSDISAQNCRSFQRPSRMHQQAG